METYCWNSYKYYQRMVEMEKILWVYFDDLIVVVAESQQLGLVDFFDVALAE
jgi:hypothetical protein